MILKIQWDNGKSTIIDDIALVDYNKFKRSDLQEVNIQGNTNKDTVYEIEYSKKNEDKKIKIYIASRFFIMNDNGRTIDVIK